MAKIVAIQFIRNCSPYNEGERAGFDQTIADKYVKNGIAHYATTEVKQAPVVKPARAEPAPEPSPPIILDAVVEEAPVQIRKKKKKTKTRRRPE